MTALLSFPITDATVARLTGRQSARHIAEERAEKLEAARKRMAKPAHLPAEVIVADCAFLAGYGDADDQLTADINMAALDRRERRRAHDEAKAEVARRLMRGKALGALSVGYLAALSVAVLLRWADLI